ncbi:S28 family serine protease [Nocardioides lentus]|uniref:S28 family serine protease n=1 Tax=Nocardioides lentus TaxID=338077 RepID=A0ABN2NXH4_9ACTN
MAARRRPALAGSLLVTGALLLSGLVSGASAAPAPASVPSSAAAGTSVVGAERAVDLRDRIRALPRVSAVTEAEAPEGYRFFRIRFRQPVDHARPNGPSFAQRLTLLHRSTTRPMVMFTSGYGVSTSPGRSEPTRIVDGNQLSMEHRFFEPSRPARPDWPRQLTIEQAATDQHLVIRSFQRLYRKNWLTTGGSKGGMTATYHRRFFPGDVDGTIPYVAPNDVVDRRDVYNAFLGRVGTSQACRDAITEVQRRVLGRDRAWFYDRALQAAEEQGLTWRIVGNPEMAWESAVVDAYFAFWQYQPESACADVPTADTGLEDVYQWFERVSSLTVYADQSIGGFTPYYYQATYQLGSPHPYENRLRDLLEFPGADVASTFVPAGLKPIRHDAGAMPDIDRWVRTQSTRMLYVYGSNDPWSAEPFTCGKGAVARECSRFSVAGGNHGASIAQLARPDQQKATMRVLDWAGLGPDDPARRVVEEQGEPERRPALDRPDVRLLGVR